MPVVAPISFLHFVYPFTFRPEEFGERVKALDDGKDWVQDKFPAGETLSHVADYLKVRDGHDPAARLWRLDTQQHKPLRLTRDMECRLITNTGKQNPQEVPFTFGGAQRNHAAVELALFGVGVGFLTVAVRPASEDIPTWLAFLHFFRVMSGNHDVSLSIAPPPNARHAAAFAQGPITYTQIRNTLLRTAALPEDGVKNWWYDVFVPERMIPFAALFVDGLEDESERGKLLYRLRNFFRDKQTVLATAEDLQVSGHPAMMPYVKGQQFLFSLEGGSFVAFDAPQDDKFFRETLPAHLRDEYFLVFLLALHQRFALMRLSQRVAERWADSAERFRQFQKIQQDFLDFSARGYFVQVMQREHHHRFYRKWHEVFQLDKLYDEVRDEVREMHEYLRMKQEERTQALISRFGIVIGLTSAVFGFLGINSVSISLQKATEVAITLAVVGAGLLLPLLWPFHKKHQSRFSRGKKKPIPAPKPKDAPPLPPPPVVRQAVKAHSYGPKAAQDETEEQTVSVRAGDGE